MKYKNTIILTFVLQISFGQIDSCRTATHIFWNNISKIEMSCFKDTISIEDNRKKCDSINLCWGACVGLWTIIDEPKKKQKRGKLIEKAYFVPAFEVAKSYRFNTDTLDYLAQLLIFDVYELAARKCRKDMELHFQKMPFYGTKLIIFKKVENSNKQFLNDIVGSITNDIYVKKKTNAYTEWRKTIDDLLNETDEYRTSNVDRIRFIKNEPLSKDYQMAKYVY
jgi:hypothetical protein